MQKGEPHHPKIPFDAKVPFDFLNLIGVLEFERRGERVLLVLKKK